MTITEEIARLLADLGLGVYDPDGTTGDIHLHTLPPTPDDALAVASYGGTAHPAIASSTPAVQIRIRCAAADTRRGEQRGQDIWDALVGLEYRTLAGGSRLQLITSPQAGPIWIGRDESGRPEWTVNLDIDLYRPTAHRPT